MTIEAKVIADSISPAGVRITTMELEYPRFIHAEFMTHRVFSRNAASSRAIPVAKVLEQVRNNPAMPIHWGKNQTGMQAVEQLNDYEKPYAHNLWMVAAHHAANTAELMAELGLHKQVANRILEPFQHIKVIVTATEWSNFFALRAHPDAQPEIQELAVQMRSVMDGSTPMEIDFDEWHLPYVSVYRDINGTLCYGEFGEQSLTDAKKISASCCAQVSYRKLDDTLDKALVIYERLVGGEPRHSSPFEHQASPMLEGDEYLCGNFTGWVQQRKVLDGPE